MTDPRRGGAWGPAIVAALFLASPSCAPSANNIYVTAEAYISAVSLNDIERILAMSAPYQRELLGARTEAEREAVRDRIEDMIERGYILWDHGKATGALEHEPLGVTLIRGIGLGKEGAASVPLGVSFEDGNTRAILISRAVTNYEGIPWDNLPQGGRMYLLGHPYPSVVNFATGYDDPSQLDLLATVDLRWTLVRIEGAPRSPLAPSDWLVETVEALPETATAWSPPPQP